MMAHRIASAPRSIAVLVGLLGLLGLTVGLAHVDLGSFNLIVALLIAVTKAFLVILFFMELVHSPQAPRIAVGMGVFMLLIFGVLTMTDYVGRHRFVTRVLPVTSSEVPFGAPAPHL